MQQPTSKDAASLPVANSLIRKISNFLSTCLAIIWLPIKWLLIHLFGHFQWQAPAWAQYSGRGLHKASQKIKANPRTSLVALVIVIALAAGGWYGYRWWQAQPKPLEVTFEVKSPGRTEIEAENPEQRKPKPLSIVFDHSVAPLANVGKDITIGVKTSPAISGTWHWDDDKTLTFTPKEDWSVGAEYKVKFERTLFAPEVRLAKYDTNFTTASFIAKISKAEFYQDPVNPNIKKVVVDLNFTHPVNPVELEKRIELKLAQQSEGVLGIGKETTPFTISYDKLKLNAYVQSASIPIPKDDTKLTFTLDKGITAVKGGEPFKEVLTQSVNVPGLYGLHVNEVRPQVVTNDRNEPEQVLMIQMSATVHERDVQKAISVWVLPKQLPNAKEEERHNWDLSEVTPAVLKTATRLELQAIPAEHEYTDLHSFKYKAEVGASLYVQIDQGIKSFGGYILGQTNRSTLQVPPFPAELKILSQGALLPLSGEKKVAVLVRDLPGLKVDIGRVLPMQLQHLVSQASGDYSNPNFYSQFGPDNLVERFERKVPLPNMVHGKAHYEAIDMAEYLKGNGNNNNQRYGVFLLTVTGYNPAQEDREKRQKEANQRQPGEPVEQTDTSEQSSCEGEGCGEQSENAESSNETESKVDKRLVLVTDLGILIKKSMDGSQDVFVQSIYTGKPVEGAAVDIVGKNGVTLFSQTTDAGGRTHFPKIDGLSRERSPLMVLVKKAGDLSFMPMNKSDRGLDVSRFDIGGAKNAAVADQLSAYLFSDRGIYRPGDTFHIGMIVKSASWSNSLVGLPLEAEIVDSRGLTLKREKLTLPTGGFIETGYTTQETAPTGAYNINLYLVKDGKAGAQIGSTSIKVQEFQPDRMKVSAKFLTDTNNNDSNEGWVNPKDLKVLVNAQNLFGTPADKRRVTAEMTLSPAFPAFKHYPDYKFYDPQRAKEGYNEKLGELVTNERGDAEFDLGLQKYAKATYRLYFMARAFEPEGGRNVAAEAVTLVSELPYLVGVKADGALDFVSRASKRNVSIIGIDPKTRKVAVNGLTLQLVERKYVSVLTKQSNDTYKYESRSKEILLSETPLNIPATGLNLALATDTPGNFSYVIRDAQGLEFNRIEYAVAGKGNVTRSLERNSELQLTLNKKDYVPGEDIEVSIKAPYIGAGLITIERDKVFAYQWFKTDTLASVQKIKLPKDFEGNAYVSVQFIRDPASDEIFMSPLSYGVVPFATSLSARTNKLTLTTPDLVKPGQTLKIKLSATKPTRAVVFAVDEGILQVARYQMPDPLSLFFQKRMLEVRTSQILDLILPEFKKLMEASAPGGDAEGALGRHLNPFKRKRDKPVVYWSGIVDVNGEKELTYQVPDYFNGSMRIMAVAVNDNAIGTAQSKSLVRGDFVLSPNVPLAVTPGDEFDVSVGVANNIATSGKDAPVTLTLTTSPHLQIIGNASQTLKISAMRESVASFRVKAVDGPNAKLGSATLIFKSSLGDKNAKLGTDVSVRPSVARYTQITMGNFKNSIDVPVTRNMYPDYRRLEAGVSPLPLILASGLSSYLANFDHLCTEQLVSQAMPALVLGKRPEFGQTGAKLPVARTLEDTLRVLRTRQNAEGGFGIWNASVQPDEFVSVYAVHMLMEAREHGETVPEDLLQKGNAYIQRLASSPGNSLPDLRARAYAAYLLTRQMVVTTPILTSIRETLEARHPKIWQTDLVAAYLAAAYQLQKQDRIATGLMDPQVNQLIKRGNAFSYEHYYDPLIRDSQTLYLLARHFPSRVKGFPPAVMQSLVKPIADNKFNTLSSAYLILALDAYANAVGPDASGKLSIVQTDANGKKTSLALPNNLLPRVPFVAGTTKLHFANDSDIASYYAVTETGFDKSAPASELRAGLEILREYVDRDGKPLTSIKVGDEIMVRLKFRAVNRNNVPNVALVDLMPGGFEPVLDVPSAPSENEQTSNADEPKKEAVSAALAGLAGARSNLNIEYADVREDRVVFYGTVNQDFNEITYRIKATNSGRFVVPPAYAESMYERGVQARSAGSKTLTVEQPTPTK